MRENEHLIFHNGKYYVGTIREYVKLCVCDPHINAGLREATPLDAEIYGYRMKRPLKEIMEAKRIVEIQNYKRKTK